MENPVAIGSQMAVLWVMCSVQRFKMIRRLNVDGFVSLHKKTVFGQILCLFAGRGALFLVTWEMQLIYPYTIRCCISPMIKTHCDQGKIAASSQ